MNNNNKKIAFIAVIVIILAFLFITFAGGNTEIAIVEFIDGFDNSTIDKQEVEVGDDAIVPNDPEHKNYVFVGWFLFGDHDIKVTNFKDIEEDLKVIALYAADNNNNGIADEDDESYTVTFIDGYTDDVIEKQNVLVGMDATAPNVPTHRGYTFIGWNKGYTNIQANTTVVAEYKRNEIAVTKYTVTFIDGDSEEVISIQRIEEGKTATLPVAPVHENRVFVKWDGEYTNIRSNTTITAVYTDDLNNDGVDDETQAHYDITYVDFNDEVLKVIEDVLVDMPTPTISNPERENYNFVNWNPEVAETVTDNAEYKATYAPVNDENNNDIADEEEPRYVVVYMNGNEEFAKYENVLVNTNTPVPTEVPEDIINFVFDGWGTVDELVSEDKTYNAVWAEDKNNDNIADYNQVLYEVRFYNEDKVTQIGEVQYVVEGEAAVAPEEPTKEGYAFNGWDVEFNNVTSNLNVNATFVDVTKPEVTPSYTEKTVSEDSVSEFTDYPTFVVTDNSNGNVVKELISGKVIISEVGEYPLVYRFTDEAGNYTDVEVVVRVVDTTKPVVLGVEEGKHYNTFDTHAIPTVSDKHLKEVYLVSKLGDKEIKLPFVDGKEIKLYGDYKLVAIDESGNTTEVNFVVDNIAPHILLLDKIEYLQGNIIPIKPVVIDQYVDNERVILKKDGKVVEGYTLGTEIKANGEYELTVFDKAGNSDTATFTIDNTSPIVVNPLGVYREYKITILEENMNDVVVLKKTKSIDVAGKLDVPIYEKYEVVDNTLNEEGEYLIIAYDKAYNVSVSKVIIDRSAPTTNLVDGKSYQEVTPEFNDNSELVVLYYKNNSIIPTKYEEGSTIVEEGKHRFVVTDIAGNVLNITIYIDKTAPVIDASAIDTKVGGINGTSMDVAAILNDIVDGNSNIYPCVSHSVNGDLGCDVKSISTGKTDVGTYTLVYNAKDKAGNEASEVVVNVEVEKVTYAIVMKDKTVVYNGKKLEPEALLKDSELNTVDGEITYTITNSKGQVVNEMINADTYTVVAHTDAYAEENDGNGIKDVTVTYTIEQAVLTVVFKEMALGDNSDSIKAGLKFVNQKGEIVDGVDSTVLLYKYTKILWSYSYLPDLGSVKEGNKYKYSVSANDDNYTISGFTHTVESEEKQF